MKRETRNHKCKLPVMFRFREEKYTGQNSPGEGVIHFGAVQQGRIQNGAIVGEVLNQREVWQRPVFRVVSHWRGISCGHDNCILKENKKESVQQYDLSQFNTKIIFLNYSQ